MANGDDTLVRDPENDTNELTDEERRRLGLMSYVTYGGNVRAPNNPDTAAPAAPDLAPIAPSSGGTASLAPIAPGSGPSKPFAKAGSIEDTQNRLDEIQWQKDHPWGTEGSTHPGTLGKIGHVLGTIGNVAGDVFAPNVVSRIPGTQANRDLTEQALETRLGKQQEAASVEKLRSAQEENYTSEAAARNNPKPKPLPGEENVATDSQGNRFQRYQMPDNSLQWAPEGSVPTIGPRTAPTAPQGGALAPIGAPAPGATPLPTQSGGAPAPGGLPAGSTVGKAEKLTETQQDVQKYLKDRNLPDTFENRQKAETEIKEGSAIGDDAAKRYSTQISNVLKGTGIDAGGYAVTKDSKSADAKEALAAAQKAATEFHTANSAAAANRRAEMESELVRAVDNDGKVHLISRADYEDNKANYQKGIIKMSPEALNKATDHATTINEVQGRANTLAQAIEGFNWKDSGQKSIVEQAMNTVHQSYADNILGIPVTKFVADNLKKLGLEGATPETRRYVTALLSMREAALGIPKEITGGSRTTEIASNALWETLPSGTTPDRKWAMEQLRGVQGILDRLKETRVPAVPGLLDVRKDPSLFQYSATNPATKHTIYSDDQKKWYDENGELVK